MVLVSWDYYLDDSFWLVFWAAGAVIAKYHKHSGQYTTQIHFSQAGKPKMKALADSMSGESLFPHRQQCGSSSGQKGKEAVSRLPQKFASPVPEGSTLLTQSPP